MRNGLHRFLGTSNVDVPTTLVGVAMALLIIAYPPRTAGSTALGGALLLFQLARLAFRRNKCGANH